MFDLQGGCWRWCDTIYFNFKTWKSFKELIFKILTYKVVAEGDVTFKTNFTLSGDKDHLGKHVHI